MSRACSRTEFNSLQNQNQLWVRSLLAGLLLLVWAFSGSSASAQAVDGSIGGTVVDGSGGVVAAPQRAITDTRGNILYKITHNSFRAIVQWHLNNGLYQVER